MNKAYAMNQQAHYEKVMRTQDGQIYGAALGSIEQLASNIPAPPPPRPGVLDMTDNAHEAFQRLSNALGDLYERLSPIVENHPTPECCEATDGNQISEASAVMGLRILVERIEGKTDEIHRLLAALRV